MNMSCLLFDCVNIAILKFGCLVQLAVALRNGVMDCLYDSTIGEGTTANFPNATGSVNNLIQHIIFELLMPFFL